MEKQNVPQLRFPEYEEEWKKTKLGKQGNFRGGGTPSTEIEEYWEGNIPWVSSSDIDENDIHNLSVTRYISKKALDESATKLIPKNSVLFVSRVGVGKLAVNKEDICTSQDFANLSSKSSDTYFIAYYFLAINRLLHKYSQGTSIKGFTTKDLKSIPINVPTLPEQQKIAFFLSAVDKKIEQLTRKKELLEKYKKGVMQKLFPKPGEQQPELRFKDENGEDFPDWEVKSLNNYLKVSKAKNEDLKYSKKDVLSVSGEFGIVNQIQFQGRSFAGASVHKYGVVETGDIVYTKSPLKSNPYGIIKVNKGEPGIVSTLYAVYKVKSNSIGEFFDYYFEIDKNTNRYLRPLVHKGAKNDMKINNARVLIDPIAVPSKKEQTKICSFLSDFDNKIELMGIELEKAITFKKGLLQQMFV
ncbi:MAG: restriction endonuclease subunit S [Balneola sp.]